MRSYACNEIIWVTFSNRSGLDLALNYWPRSTNFPLIQVARYGHRSGVLAKHTCCAGTDVVRWPRWVWDAENLRYKLIIILLIFMYTLIENRKFLFENTFVLVLCLCLCPSENQDCLTLHIHAESLITMKNIKKWRSAVHVH